MKQCVLGLIMIFLILVKSVLGYAQDTLVFSAVAGTRPVKIVGEVLRRAYQKIGIRVELLELPGKRGLMYSQAGNTDGDAFRTREIEKEYTNLKRIDVVVSTDEMYLFVKRGNEFPVKGWESISKEIIVGYQRGVQFAEKNTLKYDINTQPGDSSSQLFQMLAAGRVDAIIVGSEAGCNVIKEHDFQEIVRLDPPIHTSVLYHYLHKKHDHLVPKITAVLKEMEASGELLMIQENAELLQ